jgi:hypothetical protein
VINTHTKNLNTYKTNPSKWIGEKMSMASLESAIMVELKEVAGNKKLRLKDLMEWSTTPVTAREGETLYFLPKLKIYTAVKVIPKGE